MEKEFGEVKMHMHSTILRVPSGELRPGYTIFSYTDELQQLSITIVVLRECLIELHKMLPGATNQPEVNAYTMQTVHLHSFR